MALLPSFQRGCQTHSETPGLGGWQVTRLVQVDAGFSADLVGCGHQGLSAPHTCPSICPASPLLPAHWGWAPLPPQHPSRLPFSWDFCSPLGKASREDPLVPKPFCQTALVAGVGWEVLRQRGGEKAWGWGAAARGRNAPARAGNRETSLFLRRLRVKRFGKGSSGVNTGDDVCLQVGGNQPV